MNIDTGEIKDFGSGEELEKAFSRMTKEERENWMRVDPNSITPKQQEERLVRWKDHHSSLAVQRDILRKQKRAERRKQSKTKRHPANQRSRECGELNYRKKKVVDTLLQ